MSSLDHLPPRILVKVTDGLYNIIGTPESYYDVWLARQLPKTNGIFATVEDGLYYFDVAILRGGERMKRFIPL